MRPVSGGTDGEEVPECRICRCEGDEERPLFHPCACTGSIKWCHESCLVEWIKVSRAREYCETCGKQLIFKPVYSESTPAVLPVSEILWLSLKRVSKEIPYVVRVAFVAFLWLAFVPVWSASVFQYLRHSEELTDEPPLASWREWLAARPTPITFLTWETGVWILITGFFSLFMLVSVFDFVKGFEMGEYDTELEALRQRAQQQGVPLLPEDENGANVAEQRRRAEEARNQQVRGREVNDEDEGAPFLHENEGDGLDLGDDDDGDDMNGWGEGNNNDNNNQAGGNNQNGNNRNDLVDELGGDQLGFDEWIGLRGPWCLVLNNVMCLCFCVFMFLITFYVVPESLGRGVYREASRALVPVQNVVVETIPSSVRSGLSSLAVLAVSTTLSSSQEGKLLSLFSSTILSSASISNHPGEYTLMMKRNASSYGHAETCPFPVPYSARFVPSGPVRTPSQLAAQGGDVCDVGQIARSVKKLENYQLEGTFVMVGLLVTMGFIQTQFYACAWSWRTFLSRALRPTSPLRGMPHLVWKSVLRSIRTVVRVQKVVSLLIFKMILFPVVLGVLIDRALAPAIALSEEDRILFMSDHPHLTVLVLWVTGITHTLLVTMNVIMVRDILHQEVLDGIIRMRDPHGNQFLPLLVEPMVRQTKRTLVTCLIYTMIVFFFISLPCRAAQFLGLLPLPVTAKFFVIGVQLPLELTLFHMWMLHVLEKTKPVLMRAQAMFFRKSCEVLGLTEFLLPIPHNAIEYALAVQRAQIQAGQIHWLDSAPRVSATLLLPRQRPSFLWVRLFTLLGTAWVTWFTIASVCIAVPFFIGLGAVSSLPVVPTWVKSDVRLYFLGFLILKTIASYASKLRDAGTRLVDFATRDARDSLAFVASAFALGFLIPMMLGSFLFLETALSERDFSKQQFHGLNSARAFALFVTTMAEEVSAVRAWLAGFPLALLITAKSRIGRAFTRYLLEWRLKRAGLLAIKVLLLGSLSMVVGVFIGVEFWTRTELSSSPLYPVRLSVCLVGLGTLIPRYYFKYYGAIKAAAQSFHDALKDEKYLMGRRLANYDARVVS